MELLKAILLGITQGLTEFIPVSSSGHLILMGQALNFEHSGLGFDIALDIGTLAALFIFFRKDITELFSGLIHKNEHTRIAWYMVAATIPAVVAGVLLQHLAETAFRSTQLVAINLIWVGVLMLVVDRFARGTVNLERLRLPQAVLIGCAQALALVPGVSRSGITITAARLVGMDRVSATRFSFLLSAPIITGATLKVILTPSNFGQLTDAPGLYAAGIIAAGISGYWAIKFMITYLSRHGLAPFAIYRIALGIFVITVGIS